MNPLFKTVLDWLLARAQEPSTYAGVAALVVAYLHLSGAAVASIEDAMIGIAGLVAIILKEKGVA